MRIRTATAAAVLATAALFGSAGSAFASGGGDHYYSETNKRTNNVNWQQRVNDFSDAVLARHISTSDNDSYHSQDWTNTRIDGNFVNSFSGKFEMGDFEMED
ncbi:hypothetical protein [Streptomyces axinellae]|uniref:Uncharacterized protein n=1 Tax=Streptomyces axinellae TaxID=552788 RepID=A0ABP6DAF8_9ACTN